MNERLPKNSWLVGDAAGRYGIPPAMLCAIIEIESGWDPWAVRHEPGYKYLVAYKHALVTDDTERIMQQTSWGLMQLLGATARELGYVEPYLSGLCLPQTNLRWGCTFLAHLYKRHKNWNDAISAYNQGWPRRDPASGLFLNQGYVDKVIGAMQHYHEKYT